MFEELLPSEGMHYMETYNASEGFFALADDPRRDDMLLMLDYGTFFEFRDGERIVPLADVECGKVYAMLVTSNNGLWRYEIGDTVEFTSTTPYRIRFAGRTKQYINVFGEELIVDNADRALAAACRASGAAVAEYTVAPCYMSLRERGGARVDRGVRPRAGERRTVRRGARRGAAGRQFGLRRQAPHDARTTAHRDGSPGLFPAMDACAGQEQGPAAGERPSRGGRRARAGRGADNGTGLKHGSLCI